MTDEEKKRRALRPGDKVILWSRASMHESRWAATVTEVRKGRIYVDRAPEWSTSGLSWYAKSGKSCETPTGQCKLLAADGEKAREKR